MNYINAICPHCGILTRQTILEVIENGRGMVPEWLIGWCPGCERRSLYINNSRVYPKSITVAKANPDLPSDVSAIYAEAAIILNDSPRAAAALLRLALQILTKHLGCEGKNINNDIGFLVKNGLNPQIQMALDLVRVIGNNAVHPGEINFEDNPEIAKKLFILINLIADSMISQPKAVKELYDSVIPTSIKDHIAKRDS